MENASKALLIAGGVLIGILIISLGVSLFASISSYVESTHEDMLNNQLHEFNVQFTKYINYNEETNEKDFTLTIQDIVTLAYTANENNQKDDNYVTINMPGYSNLENDIKEISSKILTDNLGKEYKCSYSDVIFNTETGKVCEVNFYEL